MTLSEKYELSKLLHMYQDEIYNKYLHNECEADKMRRENKEVWYGNYHHGLKSQYEHARIILTKLSKEINDEIKVF